MYPPLEIANQLNIADIPDSNKAKGYLLDMESGNNVLLKLMDERNGFGTGHYDGPYKEFSDYIHGQWRNLYRWATGYEPERDVFNRPNRATVLDSLTGMVICSRWGKYKRVYRFDPELELSLAAVDEVKIPLRTLDRLPFKSFYIEFAQDGIFRPAFHGCFVEVMDMGNAFALRLVRLTDDLRTMGGSGTFHVDDTMDEPYVVIKREDIDGHHDKDPNNLRRDWEEFCFFVLNALLYLCASNADIREAAPAKKGMPWPKPAPGTEQPVVNECGYVYGETIRLARKERGTLDSGDAGAETGKKTKQRRLPRPHPVKASWQHYWTGSGENRQRVLLFKAPYFTGTGVKVATVSRVSQQLTKC